MRKSDVKRPELLRGEFRNCLHCGGEFYATRVQIKAETGKYCSQPCAGYHSPNRKHGHNGLIRNPTYSSWAGMIQRTQNSNSKMYEYYGGRGIKVDGRWLVYENFLADMGEKPVGMEIERRDNNKGYSSDNCYWATRKQQMRNTRWNRMLTHDGRTQCMSAWIEEIGLLRSTLENRIKDGWCAPFVLGVPVGIQHPTSLTFNGVTQSVAAWARLLGFGDATLRQRLRKGWSVEKALTTPLVSYNSHTKELL